jgi:hypothetical protein
MPISFADFFDENNLKIIKSVPGDKENKISNIQLRLVLLPTTGYRCVSTIFWKLSYLARFIFGKS